MKTLIYTFRTSPFKNQLPNAFIFGELNKDFKEFSSKVISDKPELIVGVANTPNNSQFERKTINRFNKTKKIIKDGPVSFELYVPSQNPFSISNKSTDSFCNWTAYKIKEFIENKHLPISLSFIHLSEKDVPKFLSSLE